MSLPKELLDQLLSGYLDDVLSPDEHTRVERLLQSNPEAVDELAQLRALRQSLKAVAQSDSVIRLEKGFADRVIGAAVARARAEGLSDDHPLVRLAEQPSTTRTATRSSSWRVAGVLVGLAASIAIAVVALRPKVPELGPTVAETQVSDPQQSPFVVPDLVAGPVTAEPDKIAASDPVSPSPVAPINNDPLVVPARSPVEAIVKSRDPVMDSHEAPTVAETEIPQERLGVVLVLDVRRTAVGRQTNAVRQAMEHASLDATSEKKITDEIVAVVSETAIPSSEEEKVSVLYLQSTAKKLDQFYLELQRDLEGIESVRLAITMNAPIVSAVKAVSPDPKMVRHGDASLELFSETGVVDQFAQQLGQLPYGPNQRKELRSMPTIGPDVPAQVLVLVR